MHDLKYGAIRFIGHDSDLLIMIKRYSIRNFKNLAAVPTEEGEFVEFGPINVLIGPNGCGKSSVLQSIDFLRAFFRTSVELYLVEKGWKYNDIPNLRQTSKTIRWEFYADLDPDQNGVGAGSYHYTVALQPRRVLDVTYEKLDWKAPGSKTVTLIERNPKEIYIYSTVTSKRDYLKFYALPSSIMGQIESSWGEKTYPEQTRFRKWVENFRSHLIWDPKILRNPDRGKGHELGPSGEHLASTIAKLRDDRPEAFNRLVDRIRRHFPTVTGLSISGRGWGWREIQLHEGDGREATFNSRQISDGVLRLLAIASLLYVDEVPPVIMLEEPENGVHPQLLREVVQMLRELTHRKPPKRVQIFFTTHSPYVLDEFIRDPQSVYCLDRPKPLAGAIITRLSQKQQLGAVQKAFDGSLGEAWTSGLIGAKAK